MCIIKFLSIVNGIDDSDAMCEIRSHLVSCATICYDMAAFISEGIGNGGGHDDKVGEIYPIEEQKFNMRYNRLDEAYCTKWNYERYMLGEIGDYICFSENDENDIYVINKDIFSVAYEECRN